MPEATFLHIRGGDETTARVLELPVGPVRIGRGALCEVRLAEPDLGDVQCMLRRRGSTWHFQPVGPPGRVWIDGHPADQQRPLPLGVPLRVGDHWLTLRAAEGSAAAWGSFNSPIPVRSEPMATAAADPRPDPQPQPQPPPDRPRAETSEAADDRLRRWQSRLDQREQWLKDRQDEKRWEARWKAAGESIRARSDRPAPPPPAAPKAASPSPAPPPGRRATQPPPVSRIVEPRPVEPLRRVADPTRHPSTVRVPLRPRPAEPAAPAPPIAPKAEAAPPPTRALVALPPPIDWSGTRSEPAEVPAPALVPEVEDREATAEPAPAAEHAAEAVDPASFDEVEDVLKAIEAGDLVEAEPAPVEIEIEPIEQPESTPLDEPELRLEESTVPVPAPAEAIPPPAAPIARRPEPVAGPEDLEVEPVAVSAEWPSARAIFAAQGIRRVDREAAPAPRTRRSTEPAPTDATAPACWTLPAWVGLVPSVAISTVLGAAGLALSYLWTVDGTAADQMAGIATRAEGMPSSPIDLGNAPRGGWWKSTAPHLAAWAMAVERVGDGEDHSEDVRGLVDAARHGSQLGASTRFAIEPTPRPDVDPARDLAHLGRSRDVVSLAWAGRRLVQAGKTEAALRAYRSALEMAARSARADLDPPDFDEDPNVRRYRLPREAILGGVLLDMARAGDWSHEQWAEALPGSSVAPMVACRVLQKAGKRAEADRMADLAIARSGAPAPPGIDPAEHRAAAAEALAYRNRWTDAAEQYRQAIDGVDDDATRRMWWLNLAEVAARVGDDSTRARAIEAAKAPDSADRVTRRALQYQQNNPGLASKGPRN